MPWKIIVEHSPSSLEVVENKGRVILDGLIAAFISVAA
ncbi:hypothetical protein NOR51B_2726 [Luminiphilus syltensis NOR5-1B]|uniref:Uncharacterized protein n=1 Tax=Luminiphilus syltensis NOR5-1B TaxID=565045 RepID=B8KVI5_9GAMM|nr:hypothetical protein NOR51B_2726 [Luminiphilus syltensis NOR5-1B]